LETSKKNQFIVKISFEKDLNDFDQFIFSKKWNLGEDYFNEMRKRLNNELRRLYMYNP